MAAFFFIREYVVRKCCSCYASGHVMHLQNWWKFMFTPINGARHHTTRPSNTLVDILHAELKKTIFNIHIFWADIKLYKYQHVRTTFDIEG